MTGPEHYVEGEQLLAAADKRDAEMDAIFGAERPTDPAVALLTARATAHFAAAKVAILASVHHPKSVAWTHALTPKDPQ